MDNEFVFLSGTTSKRAKQYAKNAAKENGTSLVSELNKIAFNEARMSWAEVSKLYSSLPKPRITLNGLFDILEKYPIGLNTPWYLSQETAHTYEQQQKIKVDFGNQIVENNTHIDDRDTDEWASLLECMNIMCYFWDQFQKPIENISLMESTQFDRGLSIDEAFDLFINSYGYDYTTLKRFGRLLVKHSDGELRGIIVDEINSSDNLKVGCLLVAAIHCGFDVQVRVDLKPKDTMVFYAKAVPVIDCVYSENIFYKTKKIQDLYAIAKVSEPENAVNIEMELDECEIVQFETIDENFINVRKLFAGHIKENRKQENR